MNSAARARRRVSQCCPFPSPLPLTNHFPIWFARSAAFAGGVLFADDTSIVLDGSTFANNSASYCGGVAFFGTNTAVPSASVRAMINVCLDGIAGATPCPFTGNTAVRWGPVLALDIASLQAFQPAVSRPGIPFTAYATLLDGFGQPVKGLPGAVLSAQLTNTSSQYSTLTGTLRTTYDIANTTLNLAVRAAEGLTVTTQFEVDATLLPDSITGLASVTIAACNNLEQFDFGTSVCACVGNATRSDNANASSPCLCNAGYVDGGFGQCSPCAAGNYSLLGGTCLPCPPLYFSQAASGACTSCPQFSTTFDNVVCQCVQGYAASGVGASMTCRRVAQRSCPARSAGTDSPARSACLASHAPPFLPQHD